MLSVDISFLILANIGIFVLLLTLLQCFRLDNFTCPKDFDNNKVTKLIDKCINIGTIIFGISALHFLIIATFNVIGKL